MARSRSHRQNLGNLVMTERNHPARAMTLDRGKQPATTWCLGERCPETVLLFHPTFYPRAGSMASHKQKPEQREQVEQFLGVNLWEGPKAEWRRAKGSSEGANTDHPVPPGRTRH